MKKFFFAIAAVALSVAFTSCGGGWTEESKKSYNETCTSMMEIVYPDDAKSICDCYVNKLAEKYPKADMKPEDAEKVMDECSADAKKKAEEKLNQQMDEMMNSMDTIPAGETPAEGAEAGHTEGH